MIPTFPHVLKEERRRKQKRVKRGEKKKGGKWGEAKANGGKEGVGSGERKRRKRKKEKEKQREKRGEEVEESGGHRVPHTT